MVPEGSDFGYEYLSAIVLAIAQCRLQDERAEIQKQKEYFAKMRVEFQPDGENTKVTLNVTTTIFIEFFCFCYVLYLG